ncbi:MAG: hypothetical protein M3342_12900 [Bacteroidota bacterium]|nr:hypothetical protein [Flavisolibacter sp.]MBD0295647.1 hypothetical protein [Flavisolibacter sp.]MDQ3844896.1 hypothetical protein [Bacteroidota bacterium]
MSIVVMGSIWLVILQAGNAFVEGGKYVASQFRQVNNYSDAYFNHPHKELKVQYGQRRTALNRTYRPQSFLDAASFEDYRYAAHFNNTGQSKDYESCSRCKAYLSHIYPSHNFW